MTLDQELTLSLIQQVVDEHQHQKLLVQKTKRQLLV
jgi:hypothetical protein